jgi:hypothetical protein
MELTGIVAAFNVIDVNSLKTRVQIKNINMGLEVVLVEEIFFN